MAICTLESLVLIVHVTLIPKTCSILQNLELWIQFGNVDLEEIVYVKTHESNNKRKCKRSIEHPIEKAMEELVEEPME
jgi:hypothetical protein